jgi:hypothetical protein
MLAAALAALHGSHTSYEDVVLSGYSSALRSCPIVHLDEMAPRDPLGRGSAALRSLVGESSRPLTEKYRPTSTLRGCPRLIVTTNNGDALRLSEEDLTDLDEAAIAQRILYVRVPTDAPEPRREVTDAWVHEPDGTPGELVRHILWLTQHHTISRRGGRLLVEGSGLAWLRQTGWHGLPRAVLISVLRSLTHGEKGMSAPAVHAIPGHADVRLEQLHEKWEELSLDAKKPSLATLSRALGRLGSRVRLGDSARTRVHRIPAETITQACEEIGIGDSDLIRQRLGLSVRL